MRNQVGRLLLSLCLPALLLVFSGCREETPEQRISRLRSAHSIRLNGWIVRAQPMSSSQDAETAEEQLAEVGAAGEPAEEGMELVGEGLSGGEEEVAEEPAVVEVIFDIVVARDSDERLPGLTLDLHRAGADEQEKEHRLIWLELPEMPRGVPMQINKILDDLTIDPGDALSVVVRESIPPEELSDYREYGQP